MSKKNNTGQIAWIDLSVKNAEEVRDFYSKVAGWKSSPVSMGTYDDFNMNCPGDENPVAGICHARGVNAEFPPYWLIYILVENMKKSVNSCKSSGGKIIVGPKQMGNQGTYCIIQDPAGAYAVLFSEKE